MKKEFNHNVISLAARIVIAKYEAILTTAFAFALLISCGEPLTDSTVNTDMPIVESYIQENTNSLSVKIYSMEVYLQDDFILSKPITGMSPTVNGKALTETSEGTYTLDLQSDTIRGAQEYTLNFDYNGATISASTTIPEKVNNLTVSPEYITVESSSYYYWDMDSDTIEIKLTWDDPEGSYYQIYIESPATSDMPDMGGGMQFRRRMMQPFKGSSYTTTSREFRTAGKYSIYVYRVNKDYADLYERISSTDLANPSSAISNAFGIFTSMSVAKTTFYVYETDE
ncbi:MAG: DUF4249 domain-containing protein [Tannerella sp.]|jgi:hypothetical protein|nr:DUF4249 domain-containing protein [Tannerella sp.]